MALVVLSGVPGSGKTTLANNLKPLFEATGRSCIIVSEPSVEEGAFSASRRETTARSDFKSAVHRSLIPDQVVIADGMNFIKGFRYELWCFARESGLSFCCAFCEATDEEATERSKHRYPAETLKDLIGRMERPNDKQKWDRPLIVVKDPNDKETLQAIVTQALSSTSKLVAKKATTKAIGNSAQVNDQLDSLVNEFSSELLKIQDTVPLGGKITVCGATFTLKRKLNPGQLRRAKREFAARAKSINDPSNIAQSFADSLSLLF